MIQVLPTAVGALVCGYKLYRSTYVTVSQKKGPQRSVLGIDFIENQGIKREFGSFLVKNKIRPDVIFGEILRNESNSCNQSCSCGNNFYTKGRAVVIVERGFYLFDTDACKAVIKHELGHIKHNDRFRINLIGSIVFCTAVFFMTLLNAEILLLCPAALILRDIILTRRAEHQADDFAIKEATSDELKGFRRFLKVGKPLSFWGKLVISFQDRSLYWSHPSDKSRIVRVEKELRMRNVLIDDKAEEEKIRRLRGFFRSTSKDICSVFAGDGINYPGLRYVTP
jgi:hypothetical protein